MSSTRRNSALRTRTVKARTLLVTAGGRRSASATSSASGSGFLSFSHSSSRLESVCRTSSPSQAIRSSKPSVRLVSGTVCRSALYASAR